MRHRSRQLGLAPVLEALIGGSQWDFVKTIGAAYLNMRIIKSLTSVLQETPEIGVNHKDVQDALGKFSLFDESHCRHLK